MTFTIDGLIARILNIIGINFDVNTVYDISEMPANEIIFVFFLIAVAVVFILGFNIILLKTLLSICRSVNRI